MRTADRWRRRATWAICGALLSLPGAPRVHQAVGATVVLATDATASLPEPASPLPVAAPGPDPASGPSPWGPVPPSDSSAPPLQPSQHTPVVVRVAIGEKLRSFALAGEGLTWIDASGQSHALGPQVIATVASGTLLLGQEPAGETVEVRSSRGGIHSGKRVYPGSIHLTRQGSRLLAVNHVDLEDYVAGVVAAETPLDWGVEVKRAQAVAVRTYTLVSMSQSGDKRYDFRNSSLVQLYDGNNVDRASRDAVASTAGLILEKGDRLVTAYYHSTCGGATVPARAMGSGAAGVVGVKDPWCATAPKASWSARFSRQELGHALERRGLADGSPVDALSVTFRGDSTSVSQVVADVGGTQVRFGGDQFRFLVGPGRILSSRFRIDTTDTGFRAVGRGFGHRSGMCQWGAQGQARAGRTFRQILAFYFPGSRVDLRV